MELKRALVELVRWAAEEEREITRRTWDAAADGSDEWTSRDIVWHLAAWRRQMASSLSNLCLATELPVRRPVTGNDDAENDVIFSEGRQQGPDEIRRASESSVDDLVSAIEASTEECLREKLPGPWRQDEPAWEAIVGSSAMHVLEHLWQLLAPAGAGAEVLRLQKRATQLVSALPAGRALQVSRYNLACFYSLNGDADEALKELAKALPGDPEFIEMARHDADLDPLRQRPEFGELLAAG